MTQREGDFTESDRMTIIETNLIVKEIHEYMQGGEIPPPIDPPPIDPPPTENEWQGELLGGIAFTPGNPTDFLSIDLSHVPEGTIEWYTLDVRMIGTPDHPNDQNLLFHLGPAKNGQVKHQDLLLYSFWQKNKYTWRQGIGVDAGGKTKDAISAPFDEQGYHLMNWAGGGANDAVWGGFMSTGSDLIGGPLVVSGKGLWMHLGGKPVFENTERAPTGVTFESVTLTIGYAAG